MNNRKPAYTYLPTAVLADQQRAEDAEAWGQRERTALAQRWAAMHEQDAHDTLGPLLGQQPTQDAQQTASAPDPASWGSPSTEGAYQPEPAPMEPAGFDMGKAVGSLGRPPDEGPAPSPLPGVRPGGPTGEVYDQPEMMAGAAVVPQQQPDPVSKTLAYLGITKPGDAAPDPESIQQQGPEPPPFLPPMRSVTGGLMMPPPIQAGHKPPPSQETQGEFLGGNPDWEKLGLRETGEMLGSQLATSPAVAQDVPGLRIGRSERSMGQAFSQGLTEGSSPGGGGGVVRAAGDAVGGAGDALGGTAPSRRFYHGTGSAFDTPDPGKFDPNGLFGPGYYLTSDPRVAGSYAETRAGAANDAGPLRTLLQKTEEHLEFVKRDPYASTYGKPEEHAKVLAAAERDAASARQAVAEAESRIDSGPNIRAVDVPEGLNLLDADKPIGRDNLRRIVQAVQDAGFDNPADQGRYLKASNSVEHVFGELESTIRRPDSRVIINRLLTEAGFDGIKYRGGKRIPITDDRGRAIEHDSYVVFPESLPKIRNAISGTPMGAAAGVTAEQNEEGETEFGFDPVAGALGAGAGSLLRRGKAPGPATAKSAAAELGRLRLDKFPEAVRDTIEQAATDGDFWRTQRRGVISDEAAEKLADDAGRTVDQMIAGGKAGKAYNTEQTRAIRNAVVAQSVKVNELATEVAADPTNGRLVAEQIAAGMKLSDLTRVAEGGRAEAGRALRAYQAFARDFAADPVDAVQRIYRAANLTPEEASAKALEFTKMTQAGADPFQMANFWAKVEKPPVTANDWFRALRYNSMLSGPRTMLVNIIGNATEVPWRLGRDVGASSLSRDLRPVAPEIRGMGAGALKGILGGVQIMRHGVTQEQAVKGDLPRSLASRLDNPVARGAANAIELPGRALGATDEFFRQLAYGLQVGRAAGIQAGKEGLSGQAWAARVDELVDKPDDALIEGALAVADRMTFKGEMGHLGEKVLAPLQDWTLGPVPVGNIVLPFLRTVYHITARGVDRSPLGLVGTGVDVLRGGYKDGAIPKGAAPLGERAGDALMGTVAFAGLALYASEGKITGKGPENAQRRKLMEANGWQAYSVRVGDDWVSYANWGPVAVSLSAAAAIEEGADPYDAFTRGAKVLTEQSYLQGVGNIFKVLDDQAGPTYGEKTVEGTLQTLVPYGAAINTVGQATDPLVRAPEKGDVGSAMEARFPGLRENVPAKQDVLGRDVDNPQQGWGAILPLRISRDKKDTVVRALLDAGVDVPEPPKAVSHENVTGIPLTEADRREYRRVTGEELSKAVSRYVASPKWGTGTQAQKAEVLQDALDAAREKAKTAILAKLGKDEIKRRLSAATPAREAVGAGARP